MIVVEDIVDSGLTLSYLLKSLQARRPRSLAICALLTKPERREVDVPVTYIGFEIPNKFVVGYGLDVNERFRNLREIGVVEPPELDGDDLREPVPLPDACARPTSEPARSTARTPARGCSRPRTAASSRSAATRRSRSRTARCAGRSTGTSTT